MRFSQNLRFRLEFAGFLLAEAAARALPLETASWLSGNLWRLIAPFCAGRIARWPTWPSPFRTCPLPSAPTWRRGCGKSRPHLRRELPSQNAGRERPHRLRARRAVRCRCARSAIHRLRPSYGQLGNPRAWGQAHGAADRRGLPAHVEPSGRSEDAHDARPALSGRPPAEDGDNRPRASAGDQGRRLSFVPRRPSRRSRAPCSSLAIPPVRTFFLPCSRVRPGCRSMPASPSAVPTSSSPSASSRFSFRRPATGTPTRSSQPKRCNASSKAFIREAPEQWMWAHRKWD